MTGKQSLDLLGLPVKYAYTELMVPLVYHVLVYIRVWPGFRVTIVMSRCSLFMKYGGDILSTWIGIVYWTGV